MEARALGDPQSQLRRVALCMLHRLSPDSVPGMAVVVRSAIRSESQGARRPAPSWRSYLQIGLKRAKEGGPPSRFGYCPLEIPGHRQVMIPEGKSGLMYMEHVYLSLFRWLE